jgi:diguanylate cyclase (GGDEF)-like protein/PAS domain S-box-containing protein
MSKKEILSIQLKQLLGASNVSLIASTLLAMVLAYMQQGLIASGIIIFWLVIVLLVAIVRAVLVHFYKRHVVEENADLYLRLVKYRIGVLFAGLSWGSAGFLLFPPSDPQHQMFLIFILAGLTAGGIVSHSADLTSSVLYSASTLIPVSIRLFVVGDSVYIAMCFAVLIYLVFMLISVRNIHKSVIGNFQLQFAVSEREEELRASVERYQLLFNNSPLPTWVIDANSLQFLAVNDRAVEHYGYTHEEFSQMTLRDIRPIEEMPELERLISSLNNGKITGELRHRKKDGTLINVSINSISINYGGISARIGIVRDITERITAEKTEKKLSRALKLLSKCESALVHADEEQMLLNEICQLAVEIGGYRMAWVGFAAKDGSKKVIPIAQMGYADGFLDKANITWDETVQGQGPAGTTIKTGVTTIIQDFQNNPKTLPWREFAIQSQYHSCIALPLFLNKQILGSLAIFSTDPNAFANEEVELLEVLASDLSFGIQTLRSRADHEASLTALKVQVEKNIVLLRNASDGIHIFDYDGNNIEVSDSFCMMLGYTREEMIGMNVSQWDTNMSYDKLMSDIRLQFKQKNRNLFETRHRRKDGTIIEVEVSSFPLDLEGKPVLFNSSRDISERKQAEHQLQIAATAFESQEGMIITDANSQILRVNQAFMAITGYTADEVIGKNPKILSSGRQDSNFYAAMWEKINSTGFWDGEIWDRRKNGEIFPEYLSITAVKNKAGLTTNYVATLTDLTQRKADEDKIEHLALFDHLTRLPNRRQLIDRLSKALSSSSRSGHEGAILFIDLDNFKNLNDTLGHDKGDLLLQQVAQRLLACVRDEDTVARLGGDEFVVMLEDLSELPIEAAAQIESVGEKILASLRNSYQLGEHPYRCTPSIGATLFDSHFEAIDELFKQADIAMYQAKVAGRNTMRFFDTQMQESIIARTTLEKDLHTALDHGQFQLYFQPQVDKALKIFGAEALIRWFHPERGLVSPAQFIPLAEETGLIIAIGEWVIDTACAQLKIWQLSSHTRHFDLAINVSAKQFRQADFVEHVFRCVKHHEIDPSHLKLELTEGMLVEDIEDVIKTMSVLKDLGIKFSLDDFGTGYSSLQYLKRLPLDQIKIDQSFVREIASDGSDKAIVQSIIAMSQSLGVAVIAEGVETKDQQEILLKLGCNLFQGYLFGKPVSIEQFEDFITNRGNAYSTIASS